MTHLVYINQYDDEIEKLRSGQKTMVITCGLRRKPSRQHIQIGDIIVFAEKQSYKTVLRGEAVVQQVFVSGKLSKEESQNLVESYNDKLLLTTEQKKRYKHKQFLVLVSISNFQELYMQLKNGFDTTSNSTWIPINDINSIKI
jgi:hypothetical protein